MAKLKLKENDRIIQQRIFKALSEDINKRLPRIAASILPQIKPIITNALINSPEMASVRNGVLRAEFGLTSDPSGEIVQAIVSTLDIQVQPVNSRNLRGGFLIVMQPSNFSNLLGLGEQPIDDGSLPWLQWLLTAGDSIIISDFGVEFGSFPQSRTGEAKMSASFAPYKVNSAFSGTPDNNFITRAISRVRKQIDNIIRAQLK